MASSVTLTVSKIRIQKDEYQTAAGTLGETEFWKSNENQAEVLQFKRALAKCRVEGPFTPLDVKLIVSLRAGFVRVRVLNREDGHEAAGAAKLLQHLFAILHHRPGYKPEGALQPMFTRDATKYMLCKTYNPHWFIAALHEVKDEKGMSFTIEDEEMKALTGTSDGKK